MAAHRTLTLEARINELRTQIAAIIDARVDSLASESPGVPREVIRNLLAARAPMCPCAQYLELNAKADE